MIETTVRVITWNVWGLYGPWQDGEAAIAATLRLPGPGQAGPLIICGDFNADPGSGEIRMLTGPTTAPVPGLSFYDAWEMAGPPAPGDTWSSNNPWATQLLWPDRRIAADYHQTRAEATNG